MTQIPFTDLPDAIRQHYTATDEVRAIEAVHVRPAPGGDKPSYAVRLKGNAGDRWTDDGRGEWRYEVEYF